MSNIIYLEKKAGIYDLVNFELNGKEYYYWFSGTGNILTKSERGKEYKLNKQVIKNGNICHFFTTAHFNLGLHPDNPIPNQNLTDLEKQFCELFCNVVIKGRMEVSNYCKFLLKFNINDLTVEKINYLDSLFDSILRIDNKLYEHIIANEDLEKTLNNKNEKINKLHQTLLSAGISPIEWSDISEDDSSVSISMFETSDNNKHYLEIELKNDMYYLTKSSFPILGNPTWGILDKAKLDIAAGLYNWLNQSNLEIVQTFNNSF